MKEETFPPPPVENFPETITWPALPTSRPASSRYSTELEKLLDLIKCVQKSKKYIFRGQPKFYDTKWRITSSLYRVLTNKSGETPTKWINLNEGALMKVMKKYQEMLIKDYRHIRPSEEKREDAHDLDILAFMQHLIRKTNLIDFTKNPYIALYFVCEENKKDDGELILLDRTKFKNLGNKKKERKRS